MVPEISVFLPNVPGQFSRVLKALEDAGLNISGFSVDLEGAISELHLLFRDAAEAHRANEALAKFPNQTMERQLLLLSRPDQPGELLRVANIMSENGINVEYGYMAMGHTDAGDVLFVLKVDEKKIGLAKERLKAAGILDHDSIPIKSLQS